MGCSASKKEIKIVIYLNSFKLLLLGAVFLLSIFSEIVIFNFFLNYY